MKMTLLTVSIVLVFIVVGCSPSEKSIIENAIARGDYQYIEKYLSNPKYLNDPNKLTANAAAVEGLILLNRIDSAITLYKENKGKPSEEMIVRAFVNALAKSKPKKMPEKLIELIDDDRNDNSNTLLRKIAVEIEPSIGVSKIKQYVEEAINDRKTSATEWNRYTYKISLSKALLWDVKGTFTDRLNLLIQKYLELAEIAIAIKERGIKEKKENVKDKESRVKEARENINDLRSGNPYNLVVVGCLQMGKMTAFATRGRETPYSYCLTELQKILKEADDNLNQAKKELKEVIIEIKEIENTLDVKIHEVEGTEAQLLKSLNDAIAG